MRELTVTLALRRPVNSILHSLEDVNGQLRRGRAFFLEVVRDSVALNEPPNHPRDTRARGRRKKRQVVRLSRREMARELSDMGTPELKLFSDSNSHSSPS